MGLEHGNENEAHRAQNTGMRTRPAMGSEHENENEVHRGLGFPICSTFQAMEQGSGPQTGQLHKAEKVEGRVPDKQNTGKMQKREPKKKLQKGEEWAIV